MKKIFVTILMLFVMLGVYSCVPKDVFISGSDEIELGSSALYKLENYDKDDIIRQYFDKDRYPYKCDFYIKSEDKFIEVHGNWTHGKHPFDENNKEDIKILELWKEKAKTSDFYKNAIYQWTDLDVRKKKTAENNNLNFEAIYP